MADEEVKFKPRKVKNIRQRKNSSDDEHNGAERGEDVS